MLPNHLFVSESDGGLYDCRVDSWSRKAPLRAVYNRTFQKIETVAELKATLRAGGYAWPGGYPLFFITSDGGALSFESVRAEFWQCVIDTRGGFGGFCITGVEINYEDNSLFCDHSGEQIKPAYECEEED